MIGFDVTKSIWFNKIGIVEIKTQFYGMKYYIGEGKGLDKHEDEQHIARVGIPVSEKMILEFFKSE